MSGLDSSAVSRLDEVVAAAVAHDEVPGAVVGVAAGEDVHVSCAGVRTVGGPAVERDTLFRIASITKPITAAAVLTLVADGLLALEDDVDRWLPELGGRRVLTRPDSPLDETVPAARAVTVRDLLTNTWGLGMHGAMFTAREPWPIVVAAAELHTFGPPTPSQPLDPDAWLARLGELPLLVQPGERWLYQTASQVLGVLAARVAGAPFERVVRERVLDPLGMRDTSFWTSDTARLATAYTHGGDGFVVTDEPDGQWARPPAFPDGGGGLLSTVDDVLRFGRALTAGGLVPDDLVAAMTSDQLTPAQKDTADWGGFSFLGDRGWGFGVSVQPDRYGWEGGSGCTWTTLPALDLTVVVLTQRDLAQGPLPLFDAAIDAAAAAVTR